VCARLLASIEDQDSCDDLPGDFVAQLSANQVGLERLEQWFTETLMTQVLFNRGLDQLNQYGRHLASSYFKRLPKGQASFEDYLDGDGYMTPTETSTSTPFLVLLFAA